MLPAISISILLPVCHLNLNRKIELEFRGQSQFNSYSPDYIWQLKFLFLRHVGRCAALNLFKLYIDSEGNYLKRYSGWSSTRVTLLFWAFVYPRSAESAQPRGLDVSPVVELHIIVAAVGLLLDFKHLKEKLHSVTLLGGDDPQTVGAAGIVVVSKLCMRVQIFCLDLSAKVSSAFWSDHKIREWKRGAL